MTDSTPRRWYTEPDTFIALAALVVSISAVAVGIYETSLQRHHDEAEVWPHVEITTYVTPKGAKIAAVNTGVGPAIVRSITVTVDGRPMHNWNEVLTALTGHVPTMMDNSTIADHALRAGDQSELLGVGIANLPQPFWQSMRRVAITICYASVFDEQWTVTDPHLGESTVWRSVKSCP